MALSRLQKILVLALAAVAVCAGAATAKEKRIALVLGNAAYEHAQPLANPVRDAEAITSLLEDLDFQVISGFDQTKMQTQETIARFAREVRGADIALFFYAGHGMQVDGSNYLLPVDARLEDETSLDFEAVQIDFILRQMSRDTGVRLVFLDACRDNPLAAVFTKANPSERATSGLAEIKIADAGAGTLIAFATGPLKVAYDGAGDHSPFTAALLARLGEKNVPLTTVMTAVTGDVDKATGGKQRPWVNVSLTGEVRLNADADLLVVGGDPTPVEVAASSSRTTTSPNTPQVSDEAQVALNILRQKIPKLEDTGPILFDKPIQFGDQAIDGKSIAELIQGKPRFPPVEGLDKSIWDTHCTSCHQWNQARLCEQAQNYVKVDTSIMRLEHPYGTRFKVALANWAQNGCK